MLVLTHSHALDFDITLALLRRDDLWLRRRHRLWHENAATFRKRLAARGLSDNEIARMVSPDRSARGAVRSHYASSSALDSQQTSGVIAEVASELIARRQLLPQTHIPMGAEA